MSEKQKKEIFFHVGTGKTGTTYLQYRVFPKLKGIYYIQRTRYKKAKDIIGNTNHDRYLLSREFDQQMEKEVKWFAADFPDTTAIIVFRRHDSYIASQYRRFVKNGFTGKFTDFFDLENDNGYFKQKDLDYFSQIQLLEQSFTRKPIVLFYEDMRHHPEEFIERLAERLKVSININSLNLSKKHSSYSEKQLKGMMRTGKRINLQKRRIFKNGFLHFLWKLYMGAIRYTVLFFARILPENAQDRNKPLIPPEELEKVKTHYATDWQKCREYAS
ncbi:MAG: hypothetical protein J7L46_01675 [Bacteroidales bacterium]|nr:hypothetical protein [Bacteroidales bacterium]